MMCVHEQLIFTPLWVICSSPLESPFLSFVLHHNINSVRFLKNLINPITRLRGKGAGGRFHFLINPNVFRRIQLSLTAPSMHLRVCRIPWWKERWPADYEKVFNLGFFTHLTFSVQIFRPDWHEMRVSRPPSSSWRRSISGRVSTESLPWPGTWRWSSSWRESLMSSGP